MIASNDLMTENDSPMMQANSDTIIKHRDLIVMTPTTNLTVADNNMGLILECKDLMTAHSTIDMALTTNSSDTTTANLTTDLDPMTVSNHTTIDNLTDKNNIKAITSRLDLILSTQRSTADMIISDLIWISNAVPTTFTLATNAHMSNDMTISATTDHSKDAVAAMIISKMYSHPLATLDL
jgi:hypothetical protein